MNEHELEPRTSERVRRLLDDSLADFDAATLSRLNQARHKALAELPRPRRWRWWQPALGLALASALMVMLLPQRIIEPTVTPAAPDMSELEMALLGDADELELLEDLEFYAWLEQEVDWDGSS